MKRTMFIDTEKYGELEVLGVELDSYSNVIEYYVDENDVDGIPMISASSVKKVYFKNNYSKSNIATKKENEEK